jgi:hypothetical protein
MSQVTRETHPDLVEYGNTYGDAANPLRDLHPEARLASELEAAGWPSVAEDAFEGTPPETLLRRLREIDEEHSTASEIIARYC